MALWPNDANPTHLIVCNEQGTTEPGRAADRPPTGAGPDDRDRHERLRPGARARPGARSSSARRPATAGQLLRDDRSAPDDRRDASTARPARSRGGIGAAEHRAARRARRLSFEGLALYAERRHVLRRRAPARATATPAGPTSSSSRPTPAGTGGSRSRASASRRWSPGTIYGLRLGKRSRQHRLRSGHPDGLGTWVPIPAARRPPTCAPQAATLKLTGYYRPEDLEIDPAALADGAGPLLRQQHRQRGGRPELGRDDLHHGRHARPRRRPTPPRRRCSCSSSGTRSSRCRTTSPTSPAGELDHPRGRRPSSLGATTICGTVCADGADDDLLSRRLRAHRDAERPDAEWTGGVFDASGKRFYVSVQHNITGHGVVLEITGWK